MNTKKILGLDLGTNSIGWAVVNAEESEKGLNPISIEDAGVRIIPMDAEQIGNFESGNTVSETADRTAARGVRRLYQRRALRRERLNRVLNVLGWLPKHYVEHLNRYGQINKGEEPKLAWINGEFLFEESFLEMCEEFKNVHPELLNNGKKISYDWTIYYLRKKALTQPISGAELAWILLQFNQKRGYNQARGDEEENEPTERKEYYTLKVVDIRDTGEKVKDRTWYEVELENGWIYKRQSAYPLDWKGKTKSFIVTTKLNKDGTEALDKEGKIKRSISAPSDDDWGLRKIKTQNDINQSKKTVGEYIYEALLNNPNEKIIGQLVRVIDRSFYYKELKAIVEKQMEFHHELNDSLYQKCIEALYPNNETYRKSISQKGFVYLFVDDIIFYQRPLKSKKSLISECPHEFRTFIDKDGKRQHQYLKCLPKSHPIYEEFRVLQFVQNLKILPEESIDKEVSIDKSEIFDWLLTQKDVDQKQLLDHVLGKKHVGYRWNYVEDKSYPMAPTSALLTKKLNEYGVKPSRDIILHLWHILYSVSDQKQLYQALKHFQEANQLSEGFCEKMSKTKPFEADYGAFSLKATKKLLSLMYSGAKWSWDAIDAKTQNRIDKLLSGEFDENISERIREKCLRMTSCEDFQGLPLWFAEYVIYDLKDTQKWESPDDIDKYIKSFRQHSLNNPIVEKVVMETLRVVRDIWRKQGTIDEIHLELAREMKQTAEQRKNDLERQKNNAAANMRARQMLVEMMNPDMGIENVRGYSPSQLELYRIYEDDILSTNEVDDEMQKIIKNLSTNSKPSSADVKKYIGWLEQKYKSPYTGEIIPLSKLFTSQYEIEHIIPQSRYFDDSFSNKVICESEVNKLKDRELAHEFIINHGGEVVTLTGGKTVRILTKEAYEKNVKEVFIKNRKKSQNLMLDEIPEGFINRQLNDSRYISRLMKGLLSNIVREFDPKTKKYEVEETSKNLIVCNGNITDRLKKEWGIDDVWNHIILPRFERMNELQKTKIFTSETLNGHIIPNMPCELNPNFQKKRVDHRHHAMDAIVIACTTRNHVNLLNNESAESKKRYDLQSILRIREEWTDTNGKKRETFKNFIKPWETFTQDVKTVLGEIIVSFKQNLRVITQCNNHSMKYVDGKKKLVKQTKGDAWAIRKSLHKETVYGLVNLRFKKQISLKDALEHVNDIVEKDLRKKLRELLAQGKDEKTIKKYFVDNKDIWQDINLQKIDVFYFTNNTKDRYYATRVALADLFKDAKEDKIIDIIENKITDTGIQKILKNWFEKCEKKTDIAFSPDGLENMNNNIQQLNGGIPHKPIYKVRKYEQANKFAVGQTGAKSKKFVEAAKGTNLFFAIYVSKDKDGKDIRSYYTIPLLTVIQCQKDGGKDWKTLLDQRMHENGEVEENKSLLYLLSPGDLVYVPKENAHEEIDKNRIYKLVSCTGNQGFFILATVSAVLIDKKEYSPLNKMERAITGEMIKEVCIPIKINRLGDIV